MCAFSHIDILIRFILTYECEPVKIKCAFSIEVTVAVWCVVAGAFG